MRRGRAITGGLGLLLLIGGLVWAVTGLHGFGGGHSRYGAYVAHNAVSQRGATNAVVVVAFDYRAFDTLGEEFILFVSAVGVVVLLRAIRQDVGEKPESELVPRERRTGELTRWVGVAMAGPLAVLAAYTVTHGQLTPGGGFQGGVILAAAVASIFLGGEYVLLLRLRRSATWVDQLEAAGAAGFAAIGFGGLIATGAFFANFIPKGSQGSLLSGGMIPLANISVGVEVAGAILLVLAELLDQRLVRSQ